MRMLDAVRVALGCSWLRVDVCRSMCPTKCGAVFHIITSHDDEGSFLIPDSLAGCCLIDDTNFRQFFSGE